MVSPLTTFGKRRLIPFSRSVGCMSIILLGYADEPLADRFCYRTGQFRITIRAANLASRAALRFPSHADTIEPFINICQT
jgi:cytochrome c oxidase assembly protein Cox11